MLHCAGLAKPAPVIETFCADELVSKYVKLDGVVTLVDSKHAMQHLNEVKPRFVVNEAVEQVAYADRIILNKVNSNSLPWITVAPKIFLHLCVALLSCMSSDTDLQKYRDTLYLVFKNFFSFGFGR